MKLGNFISNCAVTAKKCTKKSDTSECKESQLPFRQPVASMYWPTSLEKTILINRIYQFFCNLNSPKNFAGPFGKLRTEFTSPVALSTSSGNSDTNFFAHCACACAKLFLCLSNLYCFFDVLMSSPEWHLKLPINRES